MFVVVGSIIRFGLDVGGTLVWLRDIWSLFRTLNSSSLFRHFDCFVFPIVCISCSFHYHPYPGWLQGGGLGWGQERLWGYGVDQVLELELVLADGRHVKLHPTEWEDVEGYIYPKTTKVDGFCNTNTVTEDESEWNWEPCKEPAPPFEDLWFAIRGGGGYVHEDIDRLFLFCALEFLLTSIVFLLFCLLLIEEHTPWLRP